VNVPAALLNLDFTIHLPDSARVFLSSLDGLATLALVVLVGFDDSLIDLDDLDVVDVWIHLLSLLVRNDEHHQNHHSRTADPNGERLNDAHLNHDRSYNE
jgi:hypothetical protein